MAKIYKGIQELIGNTPLVEAVNLEKKLGLKATLLLKGTRIPIGEVASKVGYSDSLLFSKTFSKYFSMSPLNYRNNQTSDNK